MLVISNEHTAELAQLVKQRWEWKGAYLKHFAELAQLVEQIIRPKDE